MAGCLVVNCSQKLISLIFGTTKTSIILPFSRLWIALKSWYLWYSEQLQKTHGYNKRVVNCSQKLISLIFGTTQAFNRYIWRLLWIALKSWYLWYSEQHRLNRMTANVVVNCSQKLISLIFGTTRQYSTPQPAQLWIALKSWYLWYSEQRRSIRYGWTKSCELLSKVDIFDIRNNMLTSNSCTYNVVNCSQKLISLIFGTTRQRCCIILMRLWIALKSWYLWYSEQHSLNS